MYTYFFDIETSKVKCDDGSLVQVTYLTNIVQMNYITGEIVSSKFFRTIEESLDHISTLEECTVWCHNLDYELTFILRQLGETSGICKWSKDGEMVQGIYEEELQDIVLRDKHSPLSIKLDSLPQITFRDSYALFNKSVETLGKEIGYPKLDYDYKVVRLPWDKLEQHDYDYNERDNLIVAKNIWKYMCDNKLPFDKIPLTFTSFVKKQRKDYIQNNFGKKALTKFMFDRNEQLKDFYFFELMLKTYQGGLTASNINETGKFIKKGIYSIDKKSSYPYQMCDKYFPFFSYKTSKVYDSSFSDKAFKIGNYTGYFGLFKFKNIQVKNRNYLLPISSSQLSKGYVSSDRVQFNGKLLSASEILIPANNIDIDVINMIYNYDSIECIELVTTTKQRRLRQEEISFLLDSFHKKETIKDKESLTYALSKSAINGMYGVKVTSPIRSSYSIVNGEIQEIDYFNFNIEDREKFFEKTMEGGSAFNNQLDIFTDGCFITSYARYELVHMMKTLVDNGCNVVYSDTDSVKFYLNGASEEDIIKLIDKVNNKIISDNMENPRFVKYKEMNHVSKGDYNKITKLGIWEMETVDEQGSPKPIPTFVTYGAKKYGYIENGKVHTTVAGCNKYKPSIAIANLCKKENLPLEEGFKMIFALGTQFDETASGRTVSKVEKRPQMDMDFLTYNGQMINQYGGIIIEDTTYTLNVSISDSKLLGIDRSEKYLLKINLEGEICFE